MEINLDFFLITYQNNRDTLGWKELPEKIQVKIKAISYPERVHSEIEQVSENIYLSKFKEGKKVKFTKRNHKVKRRRNKKIKW